MDQLQSIADKIQQEQAPSLAESAWLLARARNCKWALGKIVRGERINLEDLKTVIEEFDYMEISHG